MTVIIKEQCTSRTDRRSSEDGDFLIIIIKIIIIIIIITLLQLDLQFTMKD